MNKKLQKKKNKQFTKQLISFFTQFILVEMTYRDFARITLYRQR